MASEKASRKDKNQNIQVFVRLRPLNQRERDIKSLGVVEVHNNREVVVRQSQQTSHTKKFTFDRAFAPNASQVEVYQNVVSPLIEEVLAGYNCTVFAYGQTGTGKTHTMVGEASGDETNWQNDPLAGIIPRALSQLFDELRISNTECTVRVSYLELYNEELFDLLSSSEDNSKLRIYEDVTRKGSNIVNGLEEVTVYNKNEVYKIMAQGQERKRVASTLMNAQSSRSHTVFTIVVHMKENSPEGEEFVKIGKLNLVDLAGSENISKAGSDNPGKRERARECVNINQSLLTLGRVITALVERHPHIPYRESKLTRILQESLGGRTKTSIIATVSPGHKDLEETMSTLDYAHRAKNIQNKPEINQKMTKKAILKEYAEEIDKLKRDLQAARDKNGVYLANETYAEMTLKDEEQRKEIQALLLKKRAMEEERDKLEGVFQDITSTLDKQQSELSDAKSKLHCTKTKLVETTQMLNRARVECSEQKHLVAAHVSTEGALGAQARSLLQAADVAAAHAAALHDTVDRRRNVECNNLEVTRSYRAQASSCRRHVADSATALLHSLHTTLDQLQHNLETVNSSNTQSLQQNMETLEQFIKTLADSRDEMLSLTESTQESLSAALARHRGKLATCLHAGRARLAASLAALAARLGALRAHARAEDFADVHRYLKEWLSTTASHVGSLRRAAAARSSRRRAAHAARRGAARALADARKERTDKKKQHLTVAAAEMEQERAAIERQLTALLEEIERERGETRERLQRFVDSEMQALELRRLEQQERLRRYVDSEMQAVELRLSHKLEDIEQIRQSLSAHVSRQKSVQESLLSAEDEEISLAESQLREEEAAGELEIEGERDFDEEFDEGASTVMCDAETISRQVGEVVHKSYTQLLDIITADCDTAQDECRTITEADEAVCKQLTTDTEAIDTELLKEHGTLNQNIIETLQSNNSQANTLVSTVTDSFATLSASSSSHCASQAATIGELFAALATFETELKGTVAKFEEIEAKCLTEEYRVYSPTGATPRRTEYRYPRTLAATSPHHAILARYRARSDYTNEECIVVSDSPSDTESESTMSEESAVLAAPTPTMSEESAVLAAPTPTMSEESAVFAAPTPKVPPHTNGFMKSTSETDIFLIKQNQDMGKENINRSISHKKPSKLPAPASLKKPFNERNGAVN